TYGVADPDEAWMMTVVKGKHWVAQRIPDDQISVIANCYTIDQIDLTDTTNFLGSQDIVDYAIQRGWYNPSDNKKFSFKYSYALEGTIDAIWNKPRAMTAINYLAEDKINYMSNFPFSFKPKKNLDKTNIMKILASHLEGTDFESSNTKNPHNSIASRVCSPGNQYGFVAELRNNLPKEIANVMWISIKRPCTQPYIPCYFGIEDIPEEFTYEDWQSAIKNHFKRTDLKAKTSGKAYWTYKNLADITDKNYFELTGMLKDSKKRLESTLLENQDQFEQDFINLYSKNKQDALKYLYDFEQKYILLGLNKAKQALSLLK
ncbi:MAG TPA: hypothetical protein ENK75_00680, partial [Saprospiraceae bacterium]|nr:hypothetical protein [Saprospiraceae bacterium]